MRKTVKHPRRLTERQLRFILSYLASPDATKAAIVAGYSPRTAKEIGYSLLHKNSLVRSEIIKRSRAALAKREITIDETLAENAAIAFFDPRRLYADDGTMLPIKEWPDDVAAAVASVKTHEHYEGDDRAHVVTWEVKFWNKGDALEKLFKFQRLYSEAPPGDLGTTSILNVNFDALTVDERHQLRRLLTRALPPPVVDG